MGNIGSYVMDITSGQRTHQVKKYNWKAEMGTREPSVCGRLLDDNIIIV